MGEYGKGCVARTVELPFKLLRQFQAWNTLSKPLVDSYCIIIHFMQLHSDEWIPLHRQSNLHGTLITVFMSNQIPSTIRFCRHNGDWWDLRVLLLFHYRRKMSPVTELWQIKSYLYNSEKVYIKTCLRSFLSPCSKEYRMGHTMNPFSVNIYLHAK